MLLPFPAWDFGYGLSRLFEAEVGGLVEAEGAGDLPPLSIVP